MSWKNEKNAITNIAPTGRIIGKSAFAATVTWFDIPATWGFSSTESMNHLRRTIFFKHHTDDFLFNIEKAQTNLLGFRIAARATTTAFKQITIS